MVFSKFTTICEVTLWAPLKVFSIARVGDILGYESFGVPSSHVNPWRYIEQFPGSVREN